MAFAQADKSYSFPNLIRGVTPNASIECAQHPEMAFLLPEMAGNLNFGIIVGNESKWMSQTKYHNVKRKGNKLVYKISDPLIADGELFFSVVPLQTSDGIVLEVSGNKLPDNAQLFWSYGGGYAKTLDKSQPRTLCPEYCSNNVFSVEQSAFTMYFGVTVNLKVVMVVAPVSSTIRLSDANKQNSPLAFFESGKKTLAPALSAVIPLFNGKKEYFCVYRQNKEADYNHFMLPKLFLDLNKESISMKK
jgi:hypothetical protein